VGLPLLHPVRSRSLSLSRCLPAHPTEQPSRAVPLLGPPTAGHPHAAPTTALPSVEPCLSSQLPHLLLFASLPCARSAQTPWPHTEALLPPRPTAPPLLRPKPRTSAPSPSLAVRATPFPGFLLSLERPAAGLCHYEATGARGQTTSGRLGPSRRYLRMRLVMGMLPRHFPIAGKPPPAATGCFPDILCFKLMTMDLA
jgi:hypothetical protein